MNGEWMNIHGNCTEPFVEIHTWVMRLAQTSISLLSIIFNVFIVYVTHTAPPIPYGQRRQLSAISMNFLLLAIWQLARNFFFFFSINRPCMHEMNTATCKLQEFAVVFCYIHASVLYCIIVTLTKKKYDSLKRTPSWAHICSIWQTLVAVLCIGITLIFTAFDKEEEGFTRTLKQCSILFAMNQYDLIYILLTLLMCLNGLAVIWIIWIADSDVTHYERGSIFTFCVRDVLVCEIFAWQCSLLLTGMAVFFMHTFVLEDYETFHFLLDLFFVTFPLIIAFAHPILLIWFIYPIRDSSVRIFPLLGTFLPEYALVPPPPPSKRYKGAKRRTRKQQLENGEVAETKLNGDKTNEIEVIVEETKDEPNKNNYLQVPPRYSRSNIGANKPVQL